MLSEAECGQWCGRLVLSETAKAATAHMRAAPPARRVRSAAGNVSGRSPSRKMGVTIQFERHRVELAASYAMEDDPAVLEYYDQPPSIALTYPSPHGRLLTVRHTPDSFVLRTTAAVWEEWKLEAELARLAERSPHRYVRDRDGQGRCPPGEQHAAPLGLGYRVRSSLSSAELNPVSQRNLLFLEEYLRTDQPVVPAAVRAAIIACVAAGPAGVTLADLLADLLTDLLTGIARRRRDVRGAAHGDTRAAAADDVYALIAAGQLSVDLRAAPLAEPERVRVCRLGATCAYWAARRARRCA